jgi:hypothetical protein
MCRVTLSGKIILYLHPFPAFFLSPVFLSNPFYLPVCPFIIPLSLPSYLPLLYFKISEVNII